jgi:hypothetical protein
MITLIARIIPYSKEYSFLINKEKTFIHSGDGWMDVSIYSIYSGKTNNNLGIIQMGQIFVLWLKGIGPRD